MTKSSQNQKWFIAAGFLVMAAPAVAGARPASDEAPRIQIRVFDYAAVPDPTWKRAAQAATRVFRSIGVQTVWGNCSGPRVQARKHPVCAQKPGPLTLQVGILSREMAAKSKLRGSRFGYAQTSQTGFGVIVGIFYHKVQALAKQHGASEGSLLGYLIAHEIGHLLLGTGGHSRQGIMKASWTPREVYLAGRGGIPFTPKQTKRIRSHVAKRARAVQQRQQAARASR